VAVLSSRPHPMSRLMLTSFPCASKIHDQGTGENIPVNPALCRARKRVAPCFR
jgi:hypothetical protein